MIHYQNLQFYLRLGLKLKNIYRVLEFNQSHWLKQYAEFDTHKGTEAETNVDKEGKALYKLKNNVVYGKAMQSLRNRIDVKLVSNKKDYLKWTPDPSYMSHKIYHNDLVTIHKSKVTLTLKKPEYTGMCIFELSKVLMYEFHYDYIKNKHGNNSRLLFTGTDSLMYDQDFSNDEEMFDFSNYSTTFKYYDNSNKLVLGKMKDKSVAVAIEEFVGLKPKICLYMVDDNSEHIKAKVVNKNVVAIISYNEYKKVLLNKNN